MNIGKVFDTALFASIQGLDLEQIKLYFLMRQKWSLEKVENAIAGYHQYLYLIEKVGHVSPPKDIDEIWHRHILHTAKYAKDCKKIFGRFIHHSPFPISSSIDTKLENKFCYDDEDDCDNIPVECCEGRSDTKKKKVIQFIKIVSEHFGKDWVPVAA